MYSEYVVLLNVSSKHVLTGRKWNDSIIYIYYFVIISCGFTVTFPHLIKIQENWNFKKIRDQNAVHQHLCNPCRDSVWNGLWRIWLCTWPPASGVALVLKDSDEKKGITGASIYLIRQLVWKPFLFACMNNQGKFLSLSFQVSPERISSKFISDLVN